MEQQSFDGTTLFRVAKMKAHCEEFHNTMLLDDSVADNKVLLLSQQGLELI